MVVCVGRRWVDTFTLLWLDFIIKCKLLFNDLDLTLSMLDLLVNKAKRLTWVICYFFIFQRRLIRLNLQFQNIVIGRFPQDRMILFRWFQNWNIRWALLVLRILMFSKLESWSPWSAKNLKNYIFIEKFVFLKLKLGA